MLSLLAIIAVADAGDGVVVCTRTDAGTHRRSWRLSPGAGWLFSVDNNNQRYRLLLELPLPPDSWACLAIGERLIPASSVGQDLLATTASFELTPSEADAIAALYELPRRDRVRLDEGLEVDFTAEEPWVVGGAMPVVLTLTNQGTDPVVVTLGGRYRGAGRDNRFLFAVSAEGVPLPDVGSSMDLGGLSTWSVLAPGESLQVREDVARWAQPTAAGAYSVDCRFDLELSVPRDGFSVEYAHERWERQLTERMVVEIQQP